MRLNLKTDHTRDGAVAVKVGYLLLVSYTDVGGRGNGWGGVDEEYTVTERRANWLIIDNSV